MIVSLILKMRFILLEFPSLALCGTFVLIDLGLLPLFDGFLLQCQTSENVSCLMIHIDVDIFGFKLLLFEAAALSLILAFLHQLIFNLLDYVLFERNLIAWALSFLIYVEFVGSINV